MADAPVQGVRARARAEITAEIIASAHRHLAEVGGAGLSLRAIARDVGMVSSAIYRYFASRDELLTRLIADGYGELADVAAEAAQASGSTAVRLRRIAEAMRSWALESPNVWALLFGTPIPGYEAPAATTVQVERLVTAPFGVVADGVADGEVAGGVRFETTRALRADLAAMRPLSALDDAATLRAMAWWHLVLGHISFEVFGHLTNVITDRDEYFRLQVDAASAAVLG